MTVEKEGDDARVCSIPVLLSAVNLFHTRGFDDVTVDLPVVGKPLGWLCSDLGTAK